MAKVNSIAKIMLWIWSEYASTSSKILPSARQLALFSGYSVRQVLRALHEFERIGWIKIIPGGTIQVLEDVPKSNLKQVSLISDLRVEQNRIVPAELSKDIAIRFIKDAISNGRFRINEPFPKLAWLCSEWSLSTRSIVAALRQLEEQGVIQKQGKHWHLVSHVKTNFQFRRNAKQVMFILCNRPEEWAEFHSNLMESLVRTIGEEADRCDVQLLPVLTGVEDCEAVFPTGQYAIDLLIKELGSRFVGVFLTPLRSTIPDFDQWCKWLVRKRKPIVWLQDNQPELPIIQASNFIRLQFGDWILPGKAMSDTELAVKTCTEFGHGKLFFACNQRQDFSWFRKRAEALSRYAKNYSVKIDVLENTSLSDLELIKVCLQSGASVIIAPNDHYAIRFWKLIQKQKLFLSLLSFDNLAERKPYPIDSIDFGMGLLGYQAFHWVYGDIPIKLSSKNSLIGKCKVIFNGSLKSLV